MTPIPTAAITAATRMADVRPCRRSAEGSDSGGARSSAGAAPQASRDRLPHRQQRGRSGPAAKRLDAYPNYAVDLASRVRFLVRQDREEVRQFMMKYADRVLYATDYQPGTGNDEAAAKSFVATHEQEWNFFASGEVLKFRDSEVRGPGASRPGTAQNLPRQRVRWLKISVHTLVMTDLHLCAAAGAGEIPLSPRIYGVSSVDKRSRRFPTCLFLLFAAFFCLFLLAKL